MKTGGGGGGDRISLCQIGVLFWHPRRPHHGQDAYTFVIVISLWCYKVILYYLKKVVNDWSYIWICSRNCFFVNKLCELNWTELTFCDSYPLMSTMSFTSVSIFSVWWYSRYISLWTKRPRQKSRRTSTTEQNVERLYCVDRGRRWEAYTLHWIDYTVYENTHIQQWMSNKKLLKRNKAKTKKILCENKRILRKKGSENFEANKRNACETDLCSLRFALKRKKI